MREPVLREEVEMTDDEVTYWQNEAEASLKFQKEQFTTRIGYENLIKYFEGQQYHEGTNVNTIAVVNEFSPALSNVLSSIYYQDPTVSCKANHPQADKPIQPGIEYLLMNPDFQSFTLTELMQSALKHAMKKTGMKMEMKLAAFDLITAGFSCVEVNHLSQSAESAFGTPGDEEAPEQSLPDRVLDLGKSMVGALEERFRNVKESLSQKEIEEKQAKEQPQDLRIEGKDVTYIKRWNPLDILFDSRCASGTFSESRFIGKRVRKSVAEFKAAYPNYPQDQVPEDYQSSISYQSHNKQENRKEVTLYELQIKKADGIYVLVIGKGMRKKIDYYKLPIETNGFTIKYKACDDYGKLYPMSMAKQAQKPQDDLNHYVSLQFEHADRSNRKIACHVQGLTAQGISSLNSKDPYAIVEKKSPGAVFERVPIDPTSVDNPALQQTLKEAIHKQFRTNQLQTGGGSDNKFATQDAIENQAFQVNVAGVQDSLKDLADMVLDGLKDIIMQLWDDEDYFQITGLSGGSAWYTPEMGALADILQGDYLIETDIISAQKPNPMKEKGEAIEGAQFVMSPDFQMYLQIRGKKSNMTPVENALKKLGMNPEAVIEDLQPPPGMGQPPIPVPGQEQMPPGMPPEGMPPQGMPPEMPPELPLETAEGLIG